MASAPRAALYRSGFRRDASRAPRRARERLSDRLRDLVGDGKHARGVIGLQYAPGVVKDAGVVKFRKVEIRTL